MVEAEPRLGLSSWLFFLDLDPFDGAALMGFGGRRMGDGSREGLGELLAEEDADRGGAGSEVIEARFQGGTDGNGNDDGCEWSLVAPAALSTTLFDRDNSDDSVGSSFSPEESMTQMNQLRHRR